MYDKQIVHFLDDNTLLSESQFGFRSGKNTVHRIVDLISNLLDGFQERQYSAVLYCEFSKVFDYVIHEVLLRKLIEYKF